MNDEELDKLADRIMALPGIDKGFNGYVQLEELDGEVFMKFMSDWCKTDNCNGSTMNKLLKQANVKDYEYFDRRKFIMKVSTLEALLILYPEVRRDT